MLLSEKRQVKLILMWLIAAGLLLFSNGVNSIPIASWLAPVFLLRFARKQKTRRAILFVYLTVIATFSFQFRGMVPLPGIFYCLFLLVFGIVLALPYIIDRILCNKLDGWVRTLIFPTAYAAVDYLISLSPYGSWGALAYSQYGNLQLLQLISVTGMWGITFLIGWFASVCNFVLDEGFASSKAKRIASLYAIILIGVILLGGIRLTFFPSTSQSIRVAGIITEEMEPHISLDNILLSKASDDEINIFRTWTNINNDDMLTRTVREAEAGARIVLWGEGNSLVLKEDESVLINRGREVAVENNIYFAMALMSMDFDQNDLLSFENKIVMITPEGKIIWEYFKARPVPGFETTFSIRGDAKLKSIDTPYGRLSTLICADGDFPQLAAQAGRLNADIVLNAANDWPEISPWHSRMASFRGIEQGFNQIRAASNAFSEVYDYHGHRLAAMDDSLTDNKSIVAYVPVKGVRTVYSILGDWFAWSCLAGLIVLTLLSMKKIMEQSF